MSTFYDGTKLLSMSDINGNKPEIYICTSNRSAGKTTFFNRYFIKRFLNYGEKFVLIYRFKYELDSIAEKFFNGVKTLFFTDYNMTAKSKAGGMYYDLLLSKNGDSKSEICGYAIALNCADQIKKYSHLMNDAQRMLFDEFQSETNHYATNELNKLISVHTSLARGEGKQYRYLPIFMLSNNVSLLNPYFVALGVSTRLRENTNFLRGNGFVLEQGYNTSASKALESSAFNQAFQQADYVKYASQKSYLNDNTAFIDSPKGKSKYLCTIRFKNKNFGVFEFAEEGIIFCSDNADVSYPLKLAVTTEDLRINYVMIKKNDLFISNLRYYFDNGCFRFKNLLCKECILSTLSY